MTTHRNMVEQRALGISLVATAVLGIGAVLWGIVSSSRIVLFDGVYMLAGIVLVGASILASRVADAEPSLEYPFGRSAATPLAVALQGAALLGTLFYGAADAVKVIAKGGSEAAPLGVVLYGVVSCLLSLLIALWLRRYATRSALARAELVSWRAGALLSLMVGIGGGVALLLHRNGMEDAAGYIDPLLVLLACAAIVPLAIGLIREGLREILEAAPPPALLAAVHDIVEDARSTFGLGTPVIRSTKLGRRLYVEVDFLVEHGEWQVDDEDSVRRHITDRLDALGHDVWATVELTTDASLIDD